MKKRILAMVITVIMVVSFSVQAFAGCIKCGSYNYYTHCENIWRRSITNPCSDYPYQCTSTVEVFYTAMTCEDCGHCNKYYSEHSELLLHSKLECLWKSGILCMYKLY